MAEYTIGDLMKVLSQYNPEIPIHVDTNTQCGLRLKRVEFQEADLMDVHHSYFNPFVVIRAEPK